MAWITNVDSRLHPTVRYYHYPARLVDEMRRKADDPKFQQMQKARAKLPAAATAKEVCQLAVQNQVNHSRGSMMCYAAHHSHGLWIDDVSCAVHHFDGGAR